MASVIDTCLEIMDRPFVWGKSDCFTAACDVFVALHGVDPMALLRGVYCSRASAGRMLVVHGGWLRLAETVAMQAGLVRSSGELGDIGICEDVGGQYVTAICTEFGWMAKTKSGAGRARKLQKAWRWQPY